MMLTRSQRGPTAVLRRQAIILLGKWADFGYARAKMESCQTVPKAFDKCCTRPTTTTNFHSEIRITITQMGPWMDEQEPPMSLQVVVVILLKETIQSSLLIFFPTH